MQQKHWQDGIMAFLGLWLVIFPFLVAFDLPDQVGTGWVIGSFVGSGIVIGILVLWAAVTDEIWPEVGVGLIGFWLLISPWMIGFYSNPRLTVNAVICGLVVIVLASWVVTVADNRRPS